MARQYSKVKKGMVFWFDPKSYGGGGRFPELHWKQWERI